MSAISGARFACRQSRIEFVEDLPCTPKQKLQKYRLHEAGLGPDTWDAREAGFKSER